MICYIAKQNESKFEKRAEIPATMAFLAFWLLLRWQFCSPIALEKEGEKRKKKTYYNTRYSYLVTHPSTKDAEQGLTLLSGRNMLLVLVVEWLYAEHIFLKKNSKMRKGIEKQIFDTAWLGK